MSTQGTPYGRDPDPSMENVGAGVRPGGMDPGMTGGPPPAQYPGYGGGWGGPPGYGRMFGPRRPMPIETKPFFLTSEFAALVIAIIALMITAATDESIDARMFWILTTVLVSFYMLSRGIAKSGTKSRSADPREDLLRGSSGGQGRE